MALTNPVLVSDIAAVFVSYDREGLSASESGTGNRALKSYLDGAFVQIQNEVYARGLDPDLIPGDDVNRYRTAIIWLTLQMVYDALITETARERYLEKRDEYSNKFQAAWANIEIRQDIDGDGEVDLTLRTTQTMGWRLG